MASHSVRSSHVELRESEIPKPQPLRIIKRSKTISGSTTSGETLCRGRGPSGSSEQSRGSPPLGVDRPLTVHKLRKGRGSVLNGSFDSTTGTHTGSAISDLIKKQAEKNANVEDPDITPKARKPVPRTMSAGQFLKTEFHRKSNDASSYSGRGTRGSIAPSDIDYMQHFPEAYTNPDGYPKIPERRFSKSKNFLMRAIGGRTNPDKVKSTTLAAHYRPWKQESGVDMLPRNTLIRRLSRSKTLNRVRTPWDPSASDSSECSSSNCSFTPASFDIADVSINSRISSSCGDTPQMSFGSDTVPLIPSESAVLLTPQITVTPEAPSVESGHCALWVAVEVSGTLRNADKNQIIGLRSLGPTNAKLSGTWRYGYLHSMRIDILPARNCFITELVGDLHNGDPLRVGETRLILARVSLCRTTASSHIKESSSEELIADLENDLGGTLTPYLNVRLTYKHSGFLNYEIPLLASDGMNSHTTQLQTDASAVIRRHNPQSAWSPRTSQTLKFPIFDNPLIKLAKKHLGPDRAEEAIKRLTDVEDRRVPLSRRFGFAGGSSEETVKPFTSVISPTISTTVSTSLVNAIQKSSTVSHFPSTSKPNGPFARLPSPAKGDEAAEVDPARKIWNEMRRSSRSMRHRPRPRHGRNSISADHFYSMEEDPTSSPTRNSSSDATTATIDSTQSESAIGSRPVMSDHGIEHERNRIMEMALKNKRSMGADTLRSIAPSVAKTVGKGKGGTIGGLGLGVGRSWGWGPPWW